MRNRTVDVVLVVLILAVFMTYFGFRNSMIINDPVLSKIEATKQLIERGSWQQAEVSAQSLINTWKKHKPWIYFNYGEAEVSSFTQSLNTVAGSIKYKDSASSISNLETLKDYWENFLKIVPEP